MASIHPLTKNYFLVIAHDLPNAEEQHAKHSPLHLQQNAALIESGRIKAGGGLLAAGVNSSKVAQAADGGRAGAFMVVQAENAEEVWEGLKKDVFYTSGEVWDHARITVTPVYVGAPKVE